MKCQLLYLLRIPKATISRFICARCLPVGLCFFFLADARSSKSSQDSPWSMGLASAYDTDTSAYQADLRMVCQEMTGKKVRDPTA